MSKKGFVDALRECIASNDLDDDYSVNLLESSFTEDEIIIKCWDGHNFKLKIEELESGPGYDPKTGLPRDASPAKRLIHGIKSLLKNGK